MVSIAVKVVAVYNKFNSDFGDLIYKCVDKQGNTYLIEYNGVIPFKNYLALDIRTYERDGDIITPIDYSFYPLDVIDGKFSLFGKPYKTDKIN